jgi:CDP-diacylglycerol--glycerol-3-phosphate 3-phosphatidyltransferase
VGTGRSTPRTVPGRQEYLRRWAALHGDAGTGGLVGWWLGLTHRLAVPLARRGVGPDTVTMLGLAVSVTVVPPAAVGGRWPLLAVGLVVLSGLMDNLDGAVAVLTDRVSRWGAVLDAVCDRVADTAYVVALWVSGAPGWLCALAAALSLLHEYVRARAGAAGMHRVGVVSVGERPTRVIVTAMFLLAAGLYPAASATWALLGAAAWVGTGAVGLAQVLVAVRSELLSQPHPRPDPEPGRSAQA